MTGILETNYTNQNEGTLFSGVICVIRHNSCNKNAK